MRPGSRFFRIQSSTIPRWNLFLRGRTRHDVGMPHAELGPAPATYEQFGRDFFRLAVTPNRILAALDALAGEPISFGPIGVGPGRLARVTAEGVIEQATAAPVEDELVRLLVTLPVSLRFELDLQVERQRFDARLSIPVELTARALADCHVFIDVIPPRGDQISVDLRGQGLRASSCSAWRASRANSPGSSPSTSPASSRSPPCAMPDSSTWPTPSTGRGRGPASGGDGDHRSPGKHCRRVLVET